MKKKVCNEIDPTLPGIVIISHGPMSIGMLESAQFIVGSIDNADAFSLEHDDVPEDFRSEIMDAIKKYPKGAIVFADVFGGTPANQLLRASEMMDEPLYAFTGVNLPLVLEAVSSRMGKETKDLMEQLDLSSNDSICNLTKFLSE